jgi:SAM-dependent methyltransferase
MRALTHVSASVAPDYALRVPRHFQLLLAIGVLAGVAGVGLLVATPTLPGLYGYLLLVVGLFSLAFAAVLGIITSPGLRQRARRQMLAAVVWRGDERVLDVGCGNGFLLVEAAKHLTTGTVTGIDVWKTQAGAQRAEVALRNARLEGVADRVDIKNVDARAMPFADHTFDVIVSSLMLHHAGGAGDRHRVLQEMARVLKPQGTLLLYDVSPLIANAARQLRANGVTSIDRSGRIMARLSARQPSAA